jgi:hypothetical protein
VVAAVAFVVAVATILLGQLDVTIQGTRIFRNSHVGRPLAVAMLLATLAGRGVLAARILLPLALLLAVVPTHAYEDTVRRTTIDEHPMRAARDCLSQVRQQEYEAHRPAPGIYVIGQQKWMLHSHYYYFRHLGRWEPADTVVDETVERGLFVAGQQRPIMIGDADYQAFKARHPELLQSLPMLRLRDVLLLMPGPYGVCDPAKTRLARQEL